jgi:hypothetical protein
MNFYEFLYLAPELQKKLLWQQGVHLCSRIEGRLLFELYQLEEFYIEVCLAPRSRRIIRYSQSRSLQFLAPYLKDIHLPPFLQKLSSQML